MRAQDVVDYVRKLRLSQRGLSEALTFLNLRGELYIAYEERCSNGSRNFKQAPISGDAIKPVIDAELLKIHEDLSLICNEVLKLED